MVPVFDAHLEKIICNFVFFYPCSLLSANNFTGTIPDTFGNLKNLNEL
jgi:hypothetical protein